MTASARQSDPLPQAPKGYAIENAERALLARVLSLGAIGKSAAAFEQVVDLMPSDFVGRKHKLIWHAMKELFSRADSISFNTVEAELHRPLKTGTMLAIEEVTADYLLDLMAQRAGDLMGSAKLIRRAAVRRKMQAMAREIETCVGDESKTEAQVMTRVLELMSPVSSQVASLDGHATVTMHDAIETVFTQIGVKQRAVSAGDTSSYGISTGYTALDGAIHGFKRGHLYVIAARPSVGKSALAMNLALEAMRQSARVVFIPLEMSALEMSARALAIESSINGSDLETGNVSLEEMAHVHGAATTLQRYKTSQQFHFLEFDPLPTMAQIELKLHQHMILHGADLLVFDQMSPEALSPLKPDITLHKFMSDTVNTLRAWAKKYNVPVISMAQLNREGDRTTDGKPRLTHLAGSDSISRAADTVIILHREKSVVQGNGDLVDVMILKNRGGDELTIQLRYLPSLTKFVNL